jgi:ABC-2 type transport system permease protein
MRTLLRNLWTILRRDKVALALTFILPIIFFSIFASIFGGSSGGGGSVKPLQLLVADFDDSKVSVSMMKVLAERSEIDVIWAGTSSASDSDSEADRPEVADLPAARAAVRSGKYDAALLVPAGFGDQFPDFAGTGPAIELVYDSSNPMAQPSIVGLLQAASFQAAPDMMLDQGLGMLEESGLNFSDEQTEIIESAKGFLRSQLDGEDAGEQVGNDAAAEGETAEESSGGGMASFVRVDASPARSPDDHAKANAKAVKQKNRMISYYAASIGVMFLLFSTTGAAGSLLEEQDGGTLDRLLSSNLSMNTLLGSQWLFYSLMGFLQLLVMFVWGKFVFGLDLFTANHIAGCLIVSTVTAMAAAGFGMLLATLSRTRAQMNGISTVVVLVMSAIGGSMVPRFVMPESFQRLSKFTFNGWAIDGFLKVFWYDDPADGILQSVMKLWPQVLVLLLMTVAFMGIARICARRWEAV